MSDLNPTAPTSSELTELKEQCAQLQSQTHTLRIALLMVSLSVAGFFWLETRRNVQALAILRPQAVQITEMSKKQIPAINEVVNRLAEFGRTHPDFVPVLTKYGIAPATAPAAPGSPPAAPKK